LRHRYYIVYYGFNDPKTSVGAILGEGSNLKVAKKNACKVWPQEKIEKELASGRLVVEHEAWKVGKELLPGKRPLHETNRVRGLMIQRRRKPKK
jgi:hypothetical protein